MTISLGIIVLLGLVFSKLFEKLKLPALLGMMLVGIIIGPYGLGILNNEILLVSGDLRKIALIVILIRAGLGIKKEDIIKIGRPAITMSFIPCLLEGFTVLFASMKLFNFTFIEGGILGFIIAAVSPAVIVPSMLKLMEKGIGKEKSVPALILTGASIDDVFAITIFSVFLGMYSGGNINLASRLFSIPTSIFLGIITGLLLGVILIKIFKSYEIRDTKKMLYILSFAILLIGLEDLIKSKIQIAGLLGVMSLAFIIREKMQKVGKKMACKFNELWVFAEIILFVLVGAQVNVILALDVGYKGILLITIALIARSVGVVLSLMGTELNKKEKLFCVIGYLPKATVQAAIGGIPLSMGVKSGDLILSLAVLSIIITAPIGAIAMNAMGENLLE